MCKEVAKYLASYLFISWSYYTSHNMDMFPLRYNLFPSFYGRSQDKLHPMPTETHLIRQLPPMLLLILQFISVKSWCAPEIFPICSTLRSALACPAALSPCFICHNDEKEAAFFLFRFLDSFQAICSMHHRWGRASKVFNNPQTPVMQFVFATCLSLKVHDLLSKKPKKVKVLLQTQQFVECATSELNDFGSGIN